jgi:hypothetical protein
MGGGVSPLEWIVPPVALTHLAVDKAAPLVGQKLPPVPGSDTAKANAAAARAEAARKTMLTEADAARTREEAQLAARTETPQEADLARRRAGRVASRLGQQGKRRASETLTDPGATLSGAY